MGLTGERRKRICKVFSTAFTANQLRQIVAFSSDFTLEEVAGGSEQDLSSLTFNIVGWAERNNYVFPLISEAHELNPRNDAVVALYKSAQDWFGEELKLPTAQAVSGTSIRLTTPLNATEGHDDRLGPVNSTPSEIRTGQVPLDEADAGKKVQQSDDSKEDDDADSPVNQSFWATYVSVEIELMMASVSTAIYEMLAPQEYPLIRATIVSNRVPYKRIQITSYIEGFSSQAVDTVEVRPNQLPPIQVCQQPVLFHEQVDSLKRLTRASVHVIAENLDLRRVIVHRTMPIWVLAKDTFPFAIYDPSNGEWKNMSRFLGVYVTPYEPRVLSLLGEAADKFPETHLLGYEEHADVDAQVKVVFEALKTIAGIKYAPVFSTFNPNAGERSLRVRLPRESLEEKQATNVDGTVLFASILEALSLNPAIVVLPSHVIVGWETRPDSNEWHYLDMTKVDTRTFEEAAQFGTTLAQVMEKQRAETGDERWFYRWSLRELRGRYGIYPLE